MEGLIFGILRYFHEGKEEIQVTTTASEFLRFHIKPSNHSYVSYHKIRSHMRIFMIRIYGRLTFFKSLIFLLNEWYQ